MTVYPSEQAPALELNTVNGGKISLTEVARTNNFTLVIFYRGIHCPLCKMHLQEIEEHYQKLVDAKMKVIAVSMDPEAKAKQMAEAVAKDMEIPSLQTTIAYGLTEKQAREWGLYISKAREGTSEPDIYSEPGVFAIKPDNSIFMMSKQSAPFSRPNISQLIGGLQYAHEHKYPTRGTLTRPVVEMQ